MAIGSTAPCTDHEKKVCSFERRAISSLVIAPGAVVVPMDHLGGTCAGFRAGSDVEHRIERRQAPSLVRHYSTTTTDGGGHRPMAAMNASGVGIRLSDTFLQPPLDFALPTDPQVNMGTRTTRTTPVRTARPEPPS